MAKMSATSRDPDAHRRATEKARATRARVAREVAGVIAEQVEALIVEGDIMGGRSAAAMRLRRVAEAEQRGDREAVRAAVMDAAAAFGQWAAALDYKAPSEIATPRNGAERK